MKWWDWLTSAIPENVLLIVLTALATNAGSYFLTKRRLDQEFSQRREIEREARDLAMRREVYFEAATYYSKMGAALISKVTAMGLEGEVPEPDVGTQIKAAIIGSPAVLKHRRALDREFNRLSYQVMRLGIPVRAETLKSSGLQELSDRLASHHEAKIEAARAFIAAGNPDAAQKAVDEADAIYRDLQTAAKLRSAANAARRVAFIEQFKYLADNLGKIEAALESLVVAMRMDLGQDTTSSEFLDASQSDSAETKAIVRDMLDYLERQHVELSRQEERDRL